MTESKRVSLLIVDDEAPLMQALCASLEGVGYETRGFTSAQEAMPSLREKRFDILLTDLNMPGIDGLGLLTAALALDPDIVVVMMTGNGTIDTAVEAMKAGALDYILKPFKLNAILPVLDRAYAMRTLHRENARLAQRVEDRTAELEAANRELDAFSYSVSHDLRSPLRHIQGFTEMLSKELEGKLEGKQAHYFSVIVESTRRMGSLIDSFLEFARLGRTPIKKAPVDIEGLIKETITQMQPDMEGRKVALNIGKLPFAEGDGALLKQVVVNLLSNALKYSRKRPEARIDIGFKTGDDGPEAYYVRDNGVGFEMKYAGRLFGAFQRMHSEAEFEGIGIGLASVRSIVQRHGGKIWAEAEPDKGATFYFSLPHPYVSDRFGETA